MQLLTDELRAQLPALYAQTDDPDPTIHARFFLPGTNWTWYVVEGQQEEDDYIFFGYVNGHCLEVGYFSLSELESVGSGKRLPIERDLYFEPAPWGEVKRREGLESLPEREQNCGCLPLDETPLPVREEVADDNSQET